jgi:hypothetical protein
MRIRGVVLFVERLCNCEMECTEENVVEFIELYKESK